MYLQHSLSYIKKAAVCCKGRTEAISNSWPYCTLGREGFICEGDKHSSHFALGFVPIYSKVCTLAINHYSTFTTVLQG